MRQRRSEIVGRRGANVAKILRDDQVGCEGCEQVGINRVDAFAAGDELADLAIDFCRRGGGIDARLD